MAIDPLSLNEESKRLVLSQIFNTLGIKKPNLVLAKKLYGYHNSRSYINDVLGPNLEIFKNSTKEHHEALTILSSAYQHAI